MYRTLSLRFGIMFVMIYFAIFFNFMKGEFVWDICSQESATNLILKLDNAFQLKILKHFQSLWLSLIFKAYFLFGSSLFAVHILNLETLQISFEPITMTFPITSLYTDLFNAGYGTIQVLD